MDACFSSEEAYSASIILHENVPKLWWKMDSSDISLDMLQNARKGFYLRLIEFKGKGQEECFYKIIPSSYKDVKFYQQNLLPPYTSLYKISMADTRKIKVLIIDDSAVIRMALKRMLTASLQSKS